MKKFKDFFTKNKKNVVSFDFDNTIFMVEWNKEINDYARDENGDPIGTLNTNIAQKIKDYKLKGYKVYVLTSRNDIWREDTEDFLIKNNLMKYIDGVIFTNGSWKANKAKKLGVQIHYDDNPDELRKLKYKGIKGIRV